MSCHSHRFFKGQKLLKHGENESLCFKINGKLDHQDKKKRIARVFVRVNAVLLTNVSINNAMFVNTDSLSSPSLYQSCLASFQAINA